jgi:hypothetical protein
MYVVHSSTHTPATIDGRLGRSIIHCTDGSHHPRKRERGKYCAADYWSPAPTDGPFAAGNDVVEGG